MQSNHNPLHPVPTPDSLAEPRAPACKVTIPIHVPLGQVTQGWPQPLYPFALTAQEPPLQQVKGTWQWFAVVQAGFPPLREGA